MSPKSDSCKIDILIGNDFYLDIIQQEKKIEQPRLLLLKSKLGWILAGTVQTEESVESQASLLIFNNDTLPWSKVRGTIIADQQLAAKESLEDF